MGTTVTISAVNTGADTLTATAHGLLTGDRFRLRNIGGALPAATPALSDDVDVFAIRVDANTLKVAASSANALAGTAVDITGSGSGTSYVTYGLPLVVPRVAAALTQVMPEDDNDQWGALVALNRLLTGRTQSVWDAAVALAGSLSVGGDLYHGDRTRQFSPTRGIGSGWSRGGAAAMTSIGGGHLYVPIDMIAGDRIKSLSFKVFGNSAADVTATVVYVSPTMGTTTIGTLTVTDPVASWNTATVTGLTATSIAAGGTIEIDFDDPTSGISVGVISVGYDRPRP